MCSFTDRFEYLRHRSLRSMIDEWLTDMDPRLTVTDLICIMYTTDTNLP